MFNDGATPQTCICPVAHDLTSADHASIDSAFL
jgi:hypothetical protein